MGPPLASLPPTPSYSRFGFPAYQRITTVPFAGQDNTSADPLLWRNPLWAVQPGAFTSRPGKRDLASGRRLSPPRTHHTLDATLTPAPPRASTLPPPGGSLGTFITCYLITDKVSLLPTQIFFLALLFPTRPNACPRPLLCFRPPKGWDAVKGFPP